nr:MAG TPA: hypothetical protein [Caudoviricetes sp.]
MCMYSPCDRGGEERGWRDFLIRRPSPERAK